MRWVGGGQEVRGMALRGASTQHKMGQSMIVATDTAVMINKPSIKFAAMMETSSWIRIGSSRFVS